jgi:hypothetical protein
MRFACILPVAITVLATSAQGAVTLNIESTNFLPGQVAYIEVYATELPPAQNENLVAYSIGLNLPQGGPIIFGPGPRALAPVNHPFVFPAGTPIQDHGSTGYQIRASAALPTGVENITDNEGFLRVPVSYVPGYNGPCVLAMVSFELRNGLTEMSDDIGNVIEFVPVPGVLNPLCPEPSSALVLLFGTGLLALRRRRHMLKAVQ